MVWRINYTQSARQQLGKLDKKSAQRILDYMDERVASLENPRNLGKALAGPLGEFWRYRVGNYRIVCDIQDNVLLVLIVRIGKRNDVYRKK